MTVCVGSICNHRNSVVVVADKMVTTSLPPIEFEHPGSKIDVLTERSLFLASGQILPATQILTIARAKLTKGSVSKIEDIAKIVCEAYKTYRLNQVEELWLKPRGLTIEAFYRDGKSRSIPENLVVGLDNSMIKHNIGVDLIIAGVDESGGHVYTIANPGSYLCHDKIGYATIGSGAMHAISSLIFNKFSFEFGINKGMYYTFEAKKTSENAPGVGSDTNVALITSDGYKFLDEEEIAILTSKHRDIRKPKLEEEIQIIEDLPFEKELVNESPE